jgi:hypothetical protein
VPCGPTEALPLVLLGICTAFKEDLQASVAELVYSEPQRIPGKLLALGTNPRDPALLISELRRHMARLRPVLAARHASPATFVHSELEKCTHVFLCQNATRRALEPPQQLLPGLVEEGQDSSTTRVWEACHCVN